MEIGRAFAGDQLSDIVGERGLAASLFPSDGWDEIQEKIAGAFKGAELKATAINGYDAIDNAPTPEFENYGLRSRDSIEAAAPTRFRLEMLDEITIADDPVELIQGLLPMGPALGVVFGPPKSLKTFLLTHVSLCIADWRPYAGRAVQGGAVVYVTSEGIRGVKCRLIAMRRAMGIEGRNVPFALISTMPNLGAGKGDRARYSRKLPTAWRQEAAPCRCD